MIAEGHGWFLRRYDQRRAVQFLAFIGILPALTIEAFDADAQGRASRIVKKYGDQKLTLPDAHGLAIMQARKPGACWSTDRHLGLGGVPLAT